MVLSREERQKKLKQLCESEGHSQLESLFAAALTDSVCPGICINASCDYTTEVEPDQDAGYCEVCGTQTVQSTLVLANVI